MPIVQGLPSVDAARYRDRSNVVHGRHLQMALGSQTIGVGARPGVAGGVEGLDRAVGTMHESEQIAAHPACVLGGDGQDGVDGDGRVSRGPAGAEHGDSG